MLYKLKKLADILEDFPFNSKIEDAFHSGN